MISRRNREFVDSLIGNPHVKNARCQGTIVAVELNTGEGSSYLNSIRDEVYQVCLERGILLRPLGNIIYAMPPYCISDKELDTIYDAIACCVELTREFCCVGTSQIK